MEKVLDTFHIDEKKFIYHQEKSTAFVKSYFDKTMEHNARIFFPYLNGIDDKHYLQFGADKCSVNSFEDFCKQLNKKYRSKFKTYETRRN